MIKIPAFFKSRKKENQEDLVVNERQHILTRNTDFFLQETYNSLRSNITFSVTGKGCKIISVTSSIPSEGKSINAMNIAIAFAQINKKVLLVDCDLRRPKVHRLLELKASPGLSNVLIDEAAFEDSLHHIDELGIDILCSGDIPPNSTQLFESETMDELIKKFKEAYDYVILDTPPVNTVVDACILAKYTAGTVFIIRQNYAKKEGIVNAVSQLEFAGGKVIGFVFNNVADDNILNIVGGKYRYKYNKGYRYKYGGYKYVSHGQD